MDLPLMRRMSSMMFRRIATSIAAAVLTAGLVGATTAPPASADTGWGVRHTSDTGWGRK